MMPACSVASCVDTAEVRVSMAYAETVYFCTDHGKYVRAVVREILHVPEERPVQLVASA